MTMSDLRLLAPALERLVHVPGRHWDVAAHTEITLSGSDASVFVEFDGRRIAMSRGSGDFYEAGEQLFP